MWEHPLCEGNTHIADSCEVWDSSGLNTEASHKQAYIFGYHSKSQRCIHKKLRASCIQEILARNSVQKLLFYNFLYKIIDIKIHGTIILSLLLKGIGLGLLR
jgi:hypothetical protein